MTTWREDTSSYNMQVQLTGKLANLVFRHLWLIQLNCLNYHDSRRAEHGETAEKPWPEGTTFNAHLRRLQLPPVVTDVTRAASLVNTPVWVRI